MKAISDLKLSIDILEVDKDKLEGETSKKNRTIKDLTRSLKFYNDMIPIKDSQILKVKDEMRELNKDLDVLTTNINLLEQATQPLILKIQEQKNLYEQVINTCMLL